MNSFMVVLISHSSLATSVIAVVVSLCICRTAPVRTRLEGWDAQGALETLDSHGSAAALTSLGPAVTARNFLNKVTCFVNRVSIRFCTCVNTTCAFGLHSFQIWECKLHTGVFCSLWAGIGVPFHLRHHSTQDDDPCQFFIQRGELRSARPPARGTDALPV